MISLLPRHHAIPGTIWTLGLVSLLMDLSSELVHSLLPLFLVSTLGASMLSIGLLEGVAEATALIGKIFSGALSDHLGRRKGLLLLGYGLAALTKPLFPLAHSVEAVFVARFVDRIGKGIRGAPRDALVADVAPPAIRGACFGLRQSMDTIGAFLGPLLAILLMLWLDDLQSVLWVAVLPALLVVLLLLRLKDPTRPTETRPFRSPIEWRAWRRFSRSYWWIVAVGGLFTLARFSEAFLILRAQQLGLASQWVPLVMVVMSLCYTLSAYPAGWLSDHLRRSHVLAMGLLLLIAADLLLAVASSIPLMLCGSALWGVHMGFSQGVLATLIADNSPSELKGTAFGLFNLVGGICMLLASVVAGALWQGWGAAFTFYAGAGFALLALLLLSRRPRQASWQQSQSGCD